MSQKILDPPQSCLGHINSINASSCDDIVDQSLYYHLEEQQSYDTLETSSDNLDNNLQYHDP